MADQELALLKTAPPVALAKERVSVPELGGSVIVVGLMASESFALEAIKQAATRRALEAAAEAREGAGADGDLVAAEMSFDDWRQYGRYVPELLARTVQTPDGMALYTAEEWELVPQRYPGALERLQAVAERLSGLDRRAREKNFVSQS